MVTADKTEWFTETYKTFENNIILGLIGLKTANDRLTGCMIGFCRCFHGGKQNTDPDHEASRYGNRFFGGRVRSLTSWLK